MFSPSGQFSSLSLVTSRIIKMLCDKWFDQTTKFRFSWGFNPPFIQHAYKEVQDTVNYPPQTLWEFSTEFVSLFSFPLLEVWDAVNFLGQELGPPHRFGGRHPKLQYRKISFSAHYCIFLLRGKTWLSSGHRTIIIPQTSSAPIKSVSQATPNGLDGYFSNFSSSALVGYYYVSGFRLNIFP